MRKNAALSALSQGDSIVSECECCNDSVYCGGRIKTARRRHRCSWWPSV